MKTPVKRDGHKIKIDVLAVKEAISAGTLTERDRQTVELMLPGLCGKISKLLAAKAAERP